MPETISPPPTFFLFGFASAHLVVTEYFWKIGYSTWWGFWIIIFYFLKVQFILRV